MRLSFTCTAFAFALGGCVTVPETSPPAAVATELATASPEPIWVERQSRYTFVELTPELAQQDLLLQTIDVRLPNGPLLTVGDALRYVLRHSGYQLCEHSPMAQALFALPLPAVHFQLGPMVLRSALLTLAGPGWALQVNDLDRQLCFAQDIAEKQETAHGTL
ncbi:integrating conjugative element protein pill, pfgi-1 [Pseudomonas sp. NPDC089401]|uniref:PFGI-1 class ICE element type IV pilus protein PilL2 n=1 Tax=Pseudomonas sp. NPDC089401 TaxID=3364462 RepID=UPI0037F3FED9